MKRLTQYCVELELKNSRRVLFNTKNGRIVEIDDSIYERITTGINEVDSEWKTPELEFLNEYFLVEDHELEQQELIVQMEKMKHDPETLTLTILTNLDCNLGCKYCHENGMLTKSYMSVEGVQKTLLWIEQQVIEKQYKGISIYFYGGEPMLSMDVMESVSQSVIGLCKSRSLKWDFSVTTNGTLLNDETVNRLIAAQIHSVQVSIDGPKEIHDSRRPYLTGEGTFDLILNNVKAYMDRLSFHIRINVDKQNAEHVKTLMAYLTEQNVHHSANIYMDLVSATHERSEHCDNYVYTTIEEMMGITSLWKIQRDLGIPLNGKNVIEGLCGNMSVGNVTISPLGELYTCPGLCGIKEVQIGTVGTGYNDFFKTLIKDNIWENCTTCKYMPMCAGGCRAQAYMSTGSCVTCHCRRSYYDFVVPEYLKYKFNLDEEGMV